MTKEERLKYLHSKHIDPLEPIGELPYSKEDVADECSQMAAYEAHIRDEVNNPLTSDE